MKYAEQKTKKARIAFLKIKLSTDAKWAKQGCARIFDYQTATEQQSEQTSEDNGVGFSGADAEILSSFAKQINAGRFVGSEKQMNIMFKKMPKYAGQLDKLAQAKAAVS